MTTAILVKNPRATLAQCLASIPATAKRPDDACSAVRELYRLGTSMGIDPLFLVAQSRHETAAWTSTVWEKYCNLAGMKRKDGSGYQEFYNGVDAARAVIRHHAAYLGGDLPERLKQYTYLAERLGAVRTAKYEGTVKNVEDYGGGKWAEDPAYAAGIIRHMEAIAPDWKQAREVPAPAPDSTKKQLTVLLVAGHRSYNDTGDPNEKSRTPGLARAYKNALQAAGHKVVWLQEADGDADPDDTVGGLDTVGAMARTLIDKLKADVMLDLHYEGGGGGTGVFAIVPDETGLGTAVRGGAPGNDTWQNNAADVELAKLISQNISKATGLPLRKTTVEGVISETATGVAGTYRARLAMMAYTVPVRHYCVRLVVEHGNLSRETDRRIADSDGFQEKAAKAAADALNVYSKGPMFAAASAAK